MNEEEPRAPVDKLLYIENKVVWLPSGFYFSSVVVVNNKWWLVVRQSSDIALTFKVGISYAFLRKMLLDYGAQVAAKMFQKQN